MTEFLLSLLGILVGMATMPPLELASALANAGRFDESLAVLEQFVGDEPSNAEAHLALSGALLRSGDYRRGWAEFEWRQNANLPGVPKVENKWDGKPVPRLMVIAEQGNGDTFQFARYLSLARERCRHLVFHCQEQITKALTGIEGPDEVIVSGRALFHSQVLLMSLPHVLGMPEPYAPPGGAYLLAPQLPPRDWVRGLAVTPGFRVGIAWQGSRTYRQDAARSIPLDHFAPLSTIPGVRLISLQKGYGTEQLAGHDSIIDLGSQLDNDGKAFCETAAAMNLLDLVITSDTAVAHLAGALGRPVWLALSASPEWRWGVSGETTPWYPTMRLFRQTKRGDWAGVFKRMADGLKLLAGASR